MAATSRDIRRSRGDSDRTVSPAEADTRATASTDPAWVRPSMLGVLALTAALYVIGLDRSGYANQYYSAAVQAATRSWSAFFFGSLDAGNFITVDKPPLALWLMDISARIFGVNSWAILLPEALAGVAAVYLLFVVVKRLFGPVAAVIAAAVMATTPAAVVMFRYNNPDAVLTLLLVASGWALVRALDSGRTRWLLLSATFLGLGFNAKYLQAYVLLPALILVFAVAARGGTWHRLRQLSLAAVALVVSSLWWVGIVALVPASSRPYIGGSTNNSVIDLVLGYDGLGRIFGQGPRAVPAAATLAGQAAAGAVGGAGFGGTPGILRVFNAQLGGQVSWLLPAALVGIGVGLWTRRRAPRTDLVRAGYLLFGGWLAVHTLVFDFAGGILHSYYTVAMAPAIAALVGAGAVELWRARASIVARLTTALTVVGTAWWASQLLARTPSFAPGLGEAILAAGIVGALGLMTPPSTRGLRIAGLAAAAVATFAVMGGQVSYAISGARQTYGGGDPAAGPVAARDLGPGAGGPGAARLGPGGLPGGPPPGSFGTPPAGAFGPPPAGALGPPPAAGGPGGGGAADGALVGYLVRNQGSATWIVAVASANQSAGIQLASGLPVMAMGGFSGSDPAMTVERLQTLVASGQLRYVLLGGGGGPGGGPNSGSAAISSWVAAHGTLVNYGGSSALYDLQGASA